MAQESLELVRLRLEQVGFSNKAVWGGSIKDANVADTLVRKNRVQLISAAGVKGIKIIFMHKKLLPFYGLAVGLWKKRNKMDYADANRISTAYHTIPLHCVAFHTIPYHTLPTTHQLLFC